MHVLSALNSDKETLYTIIVEPCAVCQRCDLTIIDRSKRCKAIPLAGMIAETIGVSANITSDHGRQFESSIFADLV